MSSAPESPSAGSGAEPTDIEAATALADIRNRQGRVVKAVLVPGWYWWAIAVGIVAIGAARDSGGLVVQAVTIPLAVLAMAGLTAAMIPAIRRRVQVHASPGGPGIAAIIGLIVAVDAVTIGAIAGLAAARVSYPSTLGCAAGALVLVIAGPLVNRYLSRLMMSGIRPRDADPLEGSDSTHEHTAL